MQIQARIGILSILNGITLVFYYIVVPHLNKIGELYVMHTTTETHIPLEI